MLIRDYLQRRSHAVYFPEFDDHARRHELQVLGDAGLGIRVSHLLPDADERRLDDLTSDGREKERMRDIVRNTAHRQSILCRADVPLTFDLVATRLHGLCLEGRLTPEDPQASVESADPCTFLTPHGHRVTTALPAVKTALGQLGSLWPRRILFEELVSFVRTKVGAAGRPTADSGLERLEEHLLKCCLDDLCQLHSEPAPFAPSRANTHAQVAWPGCKRCTERSSRVAVTCRYGWTRWIAWCSVSWTAPPTLRSLARHVTAAVASGKIALLEEGQPVAPERAAAFIQQQLAACIARFAEHALLVE